MNNKINLRELRAFLILWSTQSLSTLGTAMTNFALLIWAYQQQGSALTTALLAVCTYAPYVLLSIFAGALSDRWDKKKIMLISDSFAALCTLTVLFLLSRGELQVWHLYVVNTLNGFMNTIQQPASEVATTLLCHPKYYQKISGLRSFSTSLVTMLTPILATALLTYGSLQLVILVDLCSFAVAFIALSCFIQLPKPSSTAAQTESILQSAKLGLLYLHANRGILHLMLFLAVINFTASIFNATLPAMLLSRSGGSELALGAVNTTTGLATLIGGIAATLLPAPKNRAKLICNGLLFSMSTENFILALGRDINTWCLGAVLGWIFIPLVITNMEVIFRANIPPAMQGRVYAARNTLQFFTIPLGYLLGGCLVDKVFEPFMANQLNSSLLVTLFGAGKGSGAALLFFVIGVLGMLSCLPFRFDKHIKQLGTKY